MQIVCPNCKTRPASTEVQYDELLASRYSRTSYAYTTWRSFRSTSDRGSATLCAECAAGFHRMLQLRTLGATIGNRGFLALFGSLVLLAVLVGGFPVMRQGIALDIAFVPLAISALVVLVGSVLALASRAMRPAATRFLRAK